MSDTERPGHHPTTTHAAWGAGDPHLTISRDENHTVFHITADHVSIGSDEGSTIRLDGTDPLHATIAHDDRDEYVLTLHGSGEMNANPETSETSAGTRSEILRTGARFTAGSWTLVFARAEFADHGRPYGGRQGGEFSNQPTQPARPDYRKGNDAGPDFEVKRG